MWLKFCNRSFFFRQRIFLRSSLRKKKIIKSTWHGIREVIFCLQRQIVINLNYLNIIYHITVIYNVIYHINSFHKYMHNVETKQQFIQVYIVILTAYFMQFFALFFNFVSSKFINLLNMQYMYAYLPTWENLNV